MTDISDSEKAKRLEKAIEALTDALGAYKCEFVFFEIDCGGEERDKLVDALRNDCACDISRAESNSDSGRFLIHASTETGY